MRFCDRACPVGGFFIAFQEGGGRMLCYTILENSSILSCSAAESSRTDRINASSSQSFLPGADTAAVAYVTLKISFLTSRILWPDVYFYQTKRRIS
jgi:hypothetical protein